MSTTIDSLQIEIQSNSTSAASGIDGLAKALKKLSKNSDIQNAVNSLNDLRKSLHAFVNMPSSASKIESLANSMAKLKKVGKIDLGTSLGSVKSALTSLGAIDIDGVAPQIERIAGALTPLNNVKGSGFNAMMNGLKKLDDAVDGMDSGSIDRFVAKIKELDEKLGPVSQKLVAIGSAFKGVNTSAGAAGGGLKSFRTNINATAMNLTNFVNVARDAYNALQPIIRLLARTIGDAIEWDGIEYQFGNAFGEQADEYYEKITEITDALGINKQTFMEASAMSASMLTGFGVNSADAREMGLGYTELAYDIWAAYNNVYKTMDGADGAMAAVRSAISGEVEPIRRAGFTIVDSQLKITAANHGIAYSSEKATEAQKSYLRYLTLVDQAQRKGIVGTYASEMDKAEGTVRTFSQQMKTLSQTFGAVFLPVLVKVVPWLTAFVELIGDAIIAVANFFGLDIQKVDFSDSVGGITSGADEATSSVKDTTAALKELKNATLGIDELNVISPPTANSGSGAGAGGAGWDGLDVNSLWDKSIYDQVQTQVDEIKEKIKGLLPIVGGIAAAIGGWSLLNFLDNLDDVDGKLGKLIPTVKNLAKGLTIAGISVAVGKLVWDFTGAYLEGGNKADLLKALGATVLGTALAGWLAGAAGAGIVLAVSGVVTLTRLAIELNEGSIEISDPEAIVTGIVGSIQTVIGAAITWKALGPTIKGAVKGMLGTTSLASIGTTISGALTTGWTAITGALAAVPVWGWIAAAIVALIGGAVGLAVADYDFTDVGKKVGEAVGWVFKNLTPFGISVQIGQWLKKAWNAAVEYFTEDFSWDKLLQSIGDAFLAYEEWKADFYEAGANIVEGIVLGVMEGWDNFCENLGEFFSGFWEGFCEAFGIASPAKKAKPLGKHIVEGIWAGFSEFDILKKLSEWGGKVLSGISSLFTGKKPKIENVDVKINLVKNGWTSVKNWIGSIPAVSQSVKLAKSGWSSVKSWVGTMPTLSASIKLAKSGWSTVKSWLGSLNFTLGFKLPKIGINWGSKTFAGFKISYPTGFYTYAKGGFPNMGELFIAREAGPEMVGKIGSKTTVANNEQIVEGISEGVYAAVVAAMRQSESGGSQPVNLYLDGRLVARSVEKYQRERGTSFVGQQAFTY